jgi:hypothetical protein
MTTLAVLSVVPSVCPHDSFAPDSAALASVPDRAVAVDVLASAHIPRFDSRGFSASIVIVLGDVPSPLWIP